jgi:dienelactone hydrolase
MISDCCLKSFAWNGTPVGRADKLGSHDVYITGDNLTNAILFVHDALGWTFPNNRLLADHYAKETNATVYLPDFFAGEILPFEPILAGRFDLVDMAGFTSRNSRDIREPEIFACAKLLREKYKHIGAIGFCFGGWAVFRLGAQEHDPPLVDCISTGHPTWLTKKDIDEVNVSHPLPDLRCVWLEP